MARYLKAFGIAVTSVFAIVVLFVALVVLVEWSKQSDRNATIALGGTLILLLVVLTVLIARDI